MRGDRNHAEKSATGRIPVLSIDLGTSGCKCAVVTLDGEVAAWDFTPVPTHFPEPDSAEQNPSDWWAAVCKSARSVVAEASRQSLKIEAVCASAQGEGTVPIDQNGEPLHPGILWLDMRGRDAIRRVAGSGVLKVAGYNVRKLRRWIRLTGGAPALSGKDPSAHMLYLKEQLPDVYRRTHLFLNVLDYLNFRLTGRAVATPDSILTSWVTDNRDPSAIVYHEGLIQTLGIDADKLPAIVNSTDVIGAVTTSVASELGVPANVPVVAGSLDTSAAAIGSGAIADGRAHLYVGTSSWICAHVPKKRTDLFSQVASVPCARPDRYLMTALQSAAGANLSFLRDQIFFNQDELLQHDELPDVYKILDVIAARVPAGARGVLYTPWLYGERTPVDDANVRAGLLNLSMQHTREDVIRAVLEGVALNTRWMMQSVRKFLSQFTLDEITIVGGGGASDVWCQVFADVMKVRIRQVTLPLQTNVLGSAFIAGVGIGAMSFDDVPQRIQTKHVYVPNSDHAGVYDDAFRCFCDVYKRMAPLYRRMGRQRQESPS